MVSILWLMVAEMLWEEGEMMKKSFLGHDRSILCTVLQYREKEQARKVHLSLHW